MKKLNYILIFLITLPSFLVVSCESSKSTDYTPPNVSEVRLNMNDSIKFILDTVQKITITLIINDTLSTNHQIDTIIVGHDIRFRGAFMDDVALSNAFFHIWGDTINRKDVDTAYNMKRIIPMFMYGKTEAQATKMGVVLTTLTKELKRTNSSLILPVIESNVTPKDQYFFSVRCSDVAGNEDSTSVAKRPIVVFYENTLIEAFKKDASAFKYKETKQEVNK